MSTVPIIVRQVSDLIASHIEELERKLKEQNEMRLVAEGKLEELSISAWNLRLAQKAYMADRGNDALGKAVAEAAQALDFLLIRPEKAK